MRGGDVDGVDAGVGDQRSGGAAAESAVRGAGSEVSGSGDTLALMS